jgi:hypothetical protein
MRKVPLQDFHDLGVSLGLSEAKGPRVCDHPDCRETGEFRAPKSPTNVRDYYWFCRPHVEIYNRAWNYYAGLDPEEIERHIQQDAMWNRPTWPLGFRGTGVQGRFGTVDEGFKDAFELFEEEKRARANARRNGRRGGDQSGSRAQSADQKALRALQLEDGADMKTVKARYHELVKKYHPDVNGGDASAESELKRINEAYDTLKRSLIARAV